MSEEEINKKMQDFIEKIEQIVSTNIHLLKDNEILKINNIDETTLTDFVSFCLEIKNLYIKEKEKNTKLDKKFRYAVPDDIVSKLYISKDKIKEMIKEKENRIDKMHPASDCVIIDDLENQIEVLKELLED